MNHVFVLIANPAHPVLDAAAVQRASDQLQAAGAAVGPVDWLAPGVACDLPFEGPAEGPPATVSLPGIDAVALSPEGRRKRLLVADMIDTMDAMPGYGLAAPQIGIGLQLAVVDCSDTRGQAIRMANPTVLHASTQFRDHDEASPNLPGVSAVIRRPRAVTVRYLNADGEMEDRDFVNLWATSVQHQIDHLAGRMYFDHLSALKRKMLIGKSDKARRRA